MADGGFCRSCGKPVVAEAEICPNCGVRLRSAPKTTTKSRTTAILLCLFLGAIGVHKFYLGQIGMGILYIFTVGICGIGALIDLVKFIMMSDEEFAETYGR